LEEHLTLFLVADVNLQIKERKKERKKDINWLFAIAELKLKLEYFTEKTKIAKFKLLLKPQISFE
jgi:hypothetical protein